MNRILGASFAAAAAILLCVATPVGAEEKGRTSGPAAGSNVKPSTAMPENQSGTSTEATQMHPGGVAAGAPGAKAKPGTEAGPAPKSPDSGSHKRE